MYLNLVSNALKFTIEGFIQVRTRISDNSVIEVSVKDSGIGIKSGDKQKLFQKFGMGEDK